MNSQSQAPMKKRHTEAPIDRANTALAALRATESLIGQIGQLENSGSDLSLLLCLIIESLDGAIEDMYQQARQIAADALQGGVA